MIYIKYGSKSWNIKAITEIEAGRAVVIQVYGWRKKFIYKSLSLYAQHSDSSNGTIPLKKLIFTMGWRLILAPSILGMCVYARTLGMAITVREEGVALEVKFQKPV